MERVIPFKYQPKESTGIATFTLKKIDFKEKIITWDKNSHNEMLKDSTHLEDKTPLKLNAHNNTGSGY